MSKSHLLVALIAGVLCTGGCDRRDHADTGAPAVSVVVVADDTALAPLRWSPTDTRVRLVDAVPQGAPAAAQWFQVTVRGHGRTLEVPIDKYRNYELYLYRHTTGGTALGLFQLPVTADAKPIRAVVDVERIEIVTRGGAAKPPPQSKLEVARGGAVRDVTLDKLAALSLVPWRRDGRKRDTQAWSAKDVIALTGPIGEHATIRILSGDGTSRVVQPGDLDTMIMKPTDDGAFQIKQTDAAGATVWNQRDVRRIDIADPNTSG